MVNEAGIVDNPELVFGLVAPIGVNIQSVVDALASSLQSCGYVTEVIHLTSIMEATFPDLVADRSSYSAKYKSLIKNANALRKLVGHKAAMAGLCIGEIRRLREKMVSSSDTLQSPATGHAFVVRQFKRPEEIDLMREVYGEKFVQVSVFLGADEREDHIVNGIKSFNTTTIEEADAKKQAIDLIDTDNKEIKDEFGQRVEDVFHLGDVFVRGDGTESSRATISRFVNAFFGDNGISPTKDEYGMYAASGAALRSLDLSRQVGAAIFSNDGEIVTLGCNEVPKAFGGTYWGDGVPPLHRDYEQGKDGNYHRKLKILNDLVDRLGQLGLLSDRLSEKGDTDRQVRYLVEEPLLNDSQVMDIIEFGRIIHAEMCAITDAARLGKSVRGTCLFCTTFPCHMCARHIISSGISRVVFLQPYPKSFALELHGDAITLNPEERASKVLFEPFMGIAPRRYRAIFDKGRRKDRLGASVRWNEGKPVPRVADRSGAYIENEEPAISLVLKPLAG